MSIREEQCNKVCRILDDILANRPTERDSLIVAVRKAFEVLEVLELFGNSEPLPSAQPEERTNERTETHACNLIDRQAAIDALHMHLMYRMSTESNKQRLDAWINNLPSAQPEIIRCKDCRNNHWCNIQEAAMAGDNFFCGAAERRTDEQ